MFTEAYLEASLTSAIVDVNYFCKNISSQMSDWIIDTLLVR